MSKDIKKCFKVVKPSKTKRTPINQNVINTVYHLYDQIIQNNKQYIEEVQNDNYDDCKPEDYMINKEYIDNSNGLDVIDELIDQVNDSQYKVFMLERTLHANNYLFIDLEEKYILLKKELKELKELKEKTEIDFK